MFRHILKDIIQPKLTIGQPNDQYEQEADVVADQVMRMPQAPLSIQRKCEDCEEEQLQMKPLSESITPIIQKQSEEEEELQMKGFDSGAIQMKSSEANSGLSSQLSQTKGSGSKLSESTNHFMSSAFGTDFSRVNIHTNSSAVQMNRSLNARAFTHGNDVYFNEGEYSPGSSDGKRLLAHELTHVVQQNALIGKRIQKAETDDRFCGTLSDLETTIDRRVNRELAAARIHPGTSRILTFLESVRNRLGGTTAVSPLEDYIDGLSARERISPPTDLRGTKFSGAETVNRFWNLHTMGSARVAGPVIRLHGHCIGADKLGHFFQQGYDYFSMTRGGSYTVSQAESEGRGWEMRTHGLATTGVYSNADLAANLSGIDFYNDLMALPSRYRFSIASYINEQWNESENPSFYESNLATVVWRNLLQGRWNGIFTRSPSSANINIETGLVLVGSSLNGIFGYTEGGVVINGNIANGVIRQNTTTVTGAGVSFGTSSENPVSGVTIDFDWYTSSASGKATWISVNEQLLQGTWGYGHSRIDGGSWEIKK